MAGATAVMALAVWVGANVEHVQFNPWVGIALFGATILSSIIRMISRTRISTLAGSPIFFLWLAVRFLVTPAFFLIALAWLVSWAFGLAVAPALLKALTLTGVYGAAAILITSAVADLAAAIKGPGRESPSKS